MAGRPEARSEVDEFLRDRHAIVTASGRTRVILYRLPDAGEIGFAVACFGRGSGEFGLAIGGERHARSRVIDPLGGAKGGHEGYEENERPTRQAGKSHRA